MEDRLSSTLIKHSNAMLFSINSETHRNDEKEKELEKKMITNVAEHENSSRGRRFLHSESEEQRGHRRG